MAPVCWSSSRPFGVAAKFSRLSNKVSSQMSLKMKGWRQSDALLCIHMARNTVHKFLTRGNSQGKISSWEISSEAKKKKLK